jgi:fluoroquinolone transport system permease protein
MSIAAAARLDLRLQWRHGFYAAYAFTVVVYVLLLRALPADARTILLPPVLLSEASVIGFFFGGAMLHLDRSDGVLSALAVTPLDPGAWALARTLTLVLLTSLACVLVGVGAAPGAVRPLELALAGGLTAAVFVPLGLATAARFEAIERFIIGGGIATALLGLAVLPYFGVAESPLWRLLPTDAALRLLAIGAGRAPTGMAAIAVPALTLVAFTLAALVLARRVLVRHAFGRTGVGR